MDAGYAAALPLVLGAAVSPGLLAIVLLILASGDRPKARAWLYLLGTLTVLLAAALVGLVTVRALIDAFGAPPPGWSAAIKMTVALVLVGLGWRGLRPADDDHPADRLPWLEARLRAAPPPAFYVLGVATMLTNWSTILLYLGALEVIRATAPSGATALLAVCVATVLTIGPLLLPVLAVTMTGTRSDRLLSHLGHFASSHSNQIIAAVYLVLAVLIAASALNDMASALESPAELTGLSRHTSSARP